MKFDIAVKMADELVYAKTGERLDDLHLSILRGVWEGKKYIEIAEEVNRSEGYIREVGAELWRLLSEVTGEEVTKKSFRTTMERVGSVKNLESTYFANLISIVNSHHVNLYPEISDSGYGINQQNNAIRCDRHDLNEMPITEDWVGREDEVATLTRWIEVEKCRLVGIWGLPNVGKSGLAAALVDRLKMQFDAVIWRTLTPTTDLERLEREIEAVLNQPIELPKPKTPENQPSQPNIRHFFDRLHHDRCLIVLDGLETAFCAENWAGTWRSEMAGLAHWIEQAARQRHQSCVVLTSNEVPIDWNALEDKFSRTKSLQLGGLNEATAMELLQQRELADPERWLELLAIYRNHPAWIRSVSQTVCSWFEGSTAKFLDFGALLPGEVAAVLDRIGTRLTDLERKALLCLGKQSQTIPLVKLRDVLGISPMDSLALVQSLERRSLLEKGRMAGTTVLSLSPVLQAWTISLGELFQRSPPDELR